MNNFKRGDSVECWDDEEDIPRKGKYFDFNDHPDAMYPHLVRLLKKDETLDWPVNGYRCCRPALPDIRIDAPVWVRLNDNWEPRHFAGWVAGGRMKYWSTGMTSHTALTSNSWYVADQYSITPPDSDA